MTYQTVTINIEVKADIEGRKESWDYGVPRSPVFTDTIPTQFYEDFVVINGVTVSLKKLPDELVKSLWDGFCEEVENVGWNE